VSVDMKGEELAISVEKGKGTMKEVKDKVTV